MILVSSDPALIPNSKGNPFSGGYKYMGLEKLAIFDGNRLEMVRDTLSDP